MRRDHHDGRSIWAFERCGGDTCEGSTVAPLLKFDASGKLVKALGANMFVIPHGLHVDRDELADSWQAERHILGRVVA